MKQEIPKRIIDLLGIYVLVPNGSIGQVVAPYYDSVCWRVAVDWIRPVTSYKRQRHITFLKSSELKFTSWFTGIEKVNDGNYHYIGDSGSTEIFEFDLNKKSHDEIIEHIEDIYIYIW